MTRVSSYKDLVVYEKAYALCLNIYKSTMEFPREEMYGLVSQMRRSAVSTPSNIAEGYRRKTTKDYVHFLRIAYGSCAELETQICLSRDLSFLNKEIADKLLGDSDEISRMLYKLIMSLESNETRTGAGIIKNSKQAGK